MTDKNKSGKEKDLPGMGEPPATLTPEDGKGFDPRKFPGTEVVFDGTDENGDGVSVIAIPLSSVPEDLPESGTFGFPSDLPGFGSLDALDALSHAFGELSLITTVTDNLRQVGWAKDECAKAMERHGEAAPDRDAGETGGPIYNALSLCACVKQSYMALEEIFRAHCREIFERVAKGEDTRPGTDPEILGLIVDAAQAIPFCGGLTLLYFRLVKQVVPHLYDGFKAGYEQDQEPYDVEAEETKNGSDADDHLTDLREFLTRDRTKA